MVHKTADKTMIELKYTVYKLIRKGDKNEDSIPFQLHTIRTKNDLYRLSSLSGINHGPEIYEFDKEDDALNFINSKLANGSDEIYTLLKTYKNSIE